ncbi:hypothetical protein HOK31_02480 [Candidatus Poribacteria bacterium]|nr:hypothetical protein [Candidatus Poribacteria bacterium]MBT5711534.1 hypothetical protein [Candidatus Poribacteria bacterium]
MRVLAREGLAADFCRDCLARLSRSDLAAVRDAALSGESPLAAEAFLVDAASLVSGLSAFFVADPELADALRAEGREAFDDAAREAARAPCEDSIDIVSAMVDVPLA